MFPWRKRDVDVIDVAIAAGAVYLAWRWFAFGPPPFAGGSSPRPGGAFPVALTPADLDREYNFRELLPNGTRGGVGTQKLRLAAPQVIAGRNALGYGIEPADGAAARAVQAYEVARASGALPIA